MIAVPEVGQRIGDKAGNRYTITARRTVKTRIEWLLRRDDGKERWIEDGIVKAFSFHL